MGGQVSAGLGWAMAALMMAAPGQTASIHGRTVDAASGAPIAGVLVVVSDTNGQARTDRDGRFVVAGVPPGRHTIYLSIVGYALVRRDVTLAAGATLDLDIPMAAGTGTYTEAVTVTRAPFDEAEPAVPVQQALDSADLQDLRGVLADDPLHAVQALPGVSTGNDFQSEIAVRGSGYDHLTVTVDGVVAPGLLHTVRGRPDAGSVAMLNGDVLREVVLLAGSYPARYGDRTGAELDFTLRDGSRDRTVVRGSAGMATSSITAEGPIGHAHRGSWLASIRPSYLGWLLDKVDPGNTSAFNFLDGQGRVVYDLTPRQQVQATFVGGRSTLDDRDEASANGARFADDHAGLASLAWRVALGAATLVTERVSFVTTGYHNQNYQRQALARVTTHDVTARTEIAAALTSTFGVEGAVEVRRTDVDGQLWRYAIAGAAAEPFLIDTFASAGHDTRPSAFVLARWTPRPGVTISPGARLDRSSLVRRSTASPWLQAEAPLGHGLTLRAGTGIYQQFPDFEQAIGPQGGGAALEPERAWQTDVAVERARGDNVRWRVGAYARRERNGLRLPDSEFRIEDGAIARPDTEAVWRNGLEVHARGVEILLQRRAVSGFSGWLAYAFARTRVTDTLGGETYWGDFDQRHTLNLYGRYRFTNRLGLSARFRYGSNFPIPGYFRQAGHEYFLASRRNEVRLPVYARLDVRGSRTFDFAARRLTLFVEVLNVLNRRNYAPTDFSLRQATAEARGLVEELFPRLPTAGITIEF